MIFDFHTHTFPDTIAHTTVEKLQALSHSRPFTDGTRNGLAQSMVQAGIDGALILPVATNTRQVPHVNDASAQLNALAPQSGIYSFGCMHPDFSDWKQELGRIAQLGLKGIKLHPVYQGVDFDDLRYLRILDRCGELGLLVLTHAGLDIGFPGKVNCSPDMILRAVRQVGPVTLILAHMGGWRNWEQVAQLLPETQVYLDTSFCLGKICPNGDGYYGPSDLGLMDPKSFLDLVHQFGPQRILFGSDSPWTSQSESRRALEALPLASNDLSAIMGGNACRLLGLG
ncbi:MAG: amidohydrolase family protein [Lawsonibacter sp.]|jgi:predicted TIM-barrel fold metal-dependent hydrolase